MERRRHWDTLESQVERNTMRIAEILSGCYIFILGWIAERHPLFSERVGAQGGHEIASQGYGRELVSNYTRDEFVERTA